MGFPQARVFITGRGADIAPIVSGKGELGCMGPVFLAIFPPNDEFCGKIELFSVKQIDTNGCSYYSQSR